MAKDAVMESDTDFIPLKGLRGMIARNLRQAWQAPRVAQGVSANVSQCQALIATLRQESGMKVTMTHLLIKALASTLQEHPAVNATVSDEGIKLEKDANIAVAIATGLGLLVPVMMKVQEKSVLDIVAELKELAEKAKANKLPASAYQKGTFTLSALGATGVDWFTPVLNPPQAGIIGAGTISERAVVSDGEIAVAPVMELTLVFDHRALDGYPAGLFLNDLKSRLEAASF